ncbi:MFS transporter [Bacterioplanes sanyensis]|uniref:MFS transporter n=1 Tax=Bacterioplanes sanyensis TaxID=1249553 RepID=UPI0012FDEB01|nr:MFS transporter [Bacterioplanes sanyensis]
MNHSSASAAVRPPFKRLSLFYALYFALLGCIAPFWGLYLEQRGFSASEIGTLMAVFGLVRILAPNVWAWVGRHHLSPLPMIRLAGFFTLLCFSAMPWVDSFYGMALVMLTYGFFWAAMLPQYEALTLQAVASRMEWYGRIRVWGSIGFIAAVVVLGALLEKWSMDWLPRVMWLLMLVIWLNAWTLPAAIGRSIAQAVSGGVMRCLAQRPVWLFLLMTLLLQVSFGPYYTFFSIYLEQHGYGRIPVGLLWALGVLAEVLFFWQFHRVMLRLSWRHWFSLALLLTAVRWWVIGAQVESLSWIVLVQLFHAFSFAAMHAVSMRYLQHYFPGPLLASGQAVYSSLGFGLGGAIGAWLSGLAWQSMGGSVVFYAAGLIALLAAMMAWLALPKRLTTA